MTQLHRDRYPILKNVARVPWNFTRLSQLRDVEKCYKNIEGRSIICTLLFQWHISMHIDIYWRYHNNFINNANELMLITSMVMAGVSLFGSGDPHNTLRPKQNCRHSADDIFRCISIDISLKFVPKGQINNIPALVQIMAIIWTSYDKFTDASIGLNCLTSQVSVHCNGSQCMARQIKWNEMKCYTGRSYRRLWWLIKIWKLCICNIYAVVSLHFPWRM